MEEWEVEEDSDPKPYLLSSWSLETCGAGELLLGLRFVAKGDGDSGERSVQIHVPVTAALYLAEEIERQARRALC